MKDKKIIIVLILSILSLGLSISALAGYEIKNIEAVTEIEPIAPVVKSVTIKKLNGSYKAEQLMCATLQGMIQDILNNSKLGTVKLPVDTSNNSVKQIIEHLEIVISGKNSGTSEQLNQFGITLQEVGTKGSTNFFDYMPDNLDQTYQDVRDYLTSRLNLQLIKTDSSKIANELPPDFSAPALPLLHKKTQSFLPKPTELLIDKAAKPILSKAESQPTKLPVNNVPEESASTELPQPTLPVDNILEPVSTQTELLPQSAELLLNEEAPEHVSPKAEIQLKSMSPTVKCISVKLQGTKREENVLNTLQDMVNKIVNSSKLGVYRVPVPDEPLSSPVLKVYENLEIVVDAKSPAEEGLPYSVSITLQEKGHKGVPKYFAYKQDDSENFFNLLKTYLTKQLNLQPKPEKPQNSEAHE